MKVSQIHWQDGQGWEATSESIEAPQLIFAFGGQTNPKVDAIGELSKLYPKATIVGCSTAGEILADDVYDDTVVATCIQFDNTNFKVAKTGISESNQDSFHVGQKLAKQFEQEGLAGIFVLSDGLSVNGSELVKGLQEVLPKEITISGGLAGDGGKFEKTYTIYEGEYYTDCVIAVGFYGENVQLSHGTRGGWDNFGPVRRITASKGNILSEIDGEPALELYKKYLGEENSKNLPGSALLFPIVVYPEDNPEQKVVRTVLAVDQKPTP